MNSFSNRDFYTMATALRGLPPPRFIPYRVAYGMAWMAERFLKLAGRKDFMVSADAIYLSNVFRQLDNGKARRELGWNPRRLSATIRDTIDWFAANSG